MVDFASDPRSVASSSRQNDWPLEFALASTAASSVLQIDAGCFAGLVGSNLAHVAALA